MILGENGLGKSTILKAIPQMFGITLGFGLIVIAAGFGVAGLARAEPRLHLVLK